MEKDIKKEMTGYASIDKPWEKHYTYDELNLDFPSMNMKQYLIKRNEFNLNNIAINYYDRKITYKELFYNIELTKKNFVELGVKKGDVVSIASPFVPEVVYSIYALNDMGAIVNLVDPRVPSQKLKGYFNGSNTKFLVLFNAAYKKVLAIENEVDLEKVVLVSPIDSLPIGMKCLGKIKEKINESKINDTKKYIKWNKFNQLGKDNSFNIDSVYEKDKPAIIVYTSGTSGEPKGAVASNDTYNNIAASQSISLMDTKVGDKFLLIMPPFIAYGLAIGLHGQLCRGQELVMVPSFNIDNQKEMLGNLVYKYKPQTIMGVPTFMVDLIKHPKMQNLNCDFLKTVIVGGDSMTKTSEQRVNEFLEAKRSEARICKGWGLTEVNSAFSYTKDRNTNNLGSVGIPLVGNQIKIVKPVESDEINFDSLEEVKYDETGEIFINSKSAILDYLNNPEESKRVFFYSKKTGEKWIRTKDLGRITKDGNIYIDGRMKRIIIRPDGHNISPFAIENIINASEMVEVCAVVGSPSVDHEHGELAVAYIELKKEHRDKQLEILKELRNQVESLLPTRDVANEYKIIDEMPLTNIGKVDYKVLEEKEKKLIKK